MTNADTPDYQRGVVGAQKLLAQVGSGTGTVTVTLPPNTTALWVIGSPPPDADPTVTGVETGTNYPVLSLLGTVRGPSSFVPFVAFVANAIDAEVTVNVGSTPESTWYVLAETGNRFTIDLLLADTTALNFDPAPELGLQIGGWDGTDFHILLTDTSGRLEVAGSTFPPVYGVPGSAAPADALQVGGSDGTDLRAFLVDAAGHPLTIDQNLKLTVAAPGAVPPSDAIQVAGWDGTDLRVFLVDTNNNLHVADQIVEGTIGAYGFSQPTKSILVAGSDGSTMRLLLTDAAGHLLTIDQTLKLAIGATGGATPADAVLQGVTDGADIRGQLSDKRGVAWAGLLAPDTATGDHPPVELQVKAGAFGSSTQLLPAPGAGLRYRVFAAQVVADGTGLAGALNDAGAIGSFIVGSSEGAGQLQYLPSGLPLSTNQAINYVLITGTGTMIVLVLYTIETV